MLYRKDGGWALCPFKVIYKQNGQTMEQYTDDKQWWLNFAAKWDHTEIDEFQDVVYSDEQKTRLAEVQNVDEGFEYYASRYVLDGLFPNELEQEERLEDHPLRTLQLQKENEQQGQTVTGAELENIMQGQQLTDIELRLLALEVNK